jgi:hypothetical protein
MREQSTMATIETPFVILNNSTLSAGPAFCQGNSFDSDHPRIIAVTIISG